MKGCIEQSNFTKGSTTLLSHKHNAKWSGKIKVPTCACTHMHTYAHIHAHTYTHHTDTHLEYFMARIAAIKNVLSPISDTIMTEKDAAKP